MWWLVLLGAVIIGIILSIICDSPEAFLSIAMLSLMILGIMFLFGICSVKEVNVYEKEKYKIEGLENKLITER